MYALSKIKDSSCSAAQKQQAKHKSAKAKKTSSRRPKKNNKRGAGKSRGEMVPMCVREVARSVAKPFEFAACIPDGAHGVGRFTIKGAGTLTTGTGTSYGIVVQGDPGSSSFPDTGSASANSLYSGNWTSSVQYASILTMYSKFRIVSMGLRLYFTGSTMNDPGVIFAGQFSGTSLSILSLKDLNGLTGYAQYYEITPLRNGMEITWRPDDLEDQSVFFSSQPTVGAATSPISPYLLAQVYGATAGGLSSCYYEWICNYEGVFRNAAFMPGGGAGPTTPAAPGWYERSSNIISQIAPITPEFDKAKSTNFGGKLVGLASGAASLLSTMV